MSLELMRILKRGKTDLNIRNINVSYYLLIQNVENIIKCNKSQFTVVMWYEMGCIYVMYLC